MCGSHRLRSPVGDHVQAGVTLDLHVCDYRDSNRAKTQRLRMRRPRSASNHGSAAWRKLAITADGPAGG